MKTQMLPVKLTDDELLQKGEELADAHEELVEANGELKKNQDYLKNRIKGIQADISDLIRALKNKTEDREVDCEERPDYESGNMQTVRLDTGEVVYTRPLIDSEKQMQIDDDAASETREPNEESEQVVKFRVLQGMTKKEIIEKARELGMEQVDGLRKGELLSKIIEHCEEQGIGIVTGDANQDDTGDEELTTDEDQDNGDE